MSDTIAIVTGAGRGVGRAIALALASAGARVMVVARTLGDVEETASMATRAGGQCIAARVDVTSQVEVHEMAARATEELGPVNLLVNNAGGCRAIGELWTQAPELWWADVELNLKSAMLCSHAVLPEMLAQRHGRIVNVGSLQASKPNPLNSAYSCAKAALVIFGESLAAAVADRGITVLTISPGLVHTAAIDEVLATEDGARCFPELVGLPEDRYIPPERAADLVTEIASGRADVLTGRFIHVSDNLNRLVDSAAEIRNENLLTMRLRR